MSFAKKQLEKYGWKEGDGLGKDSKGISKAIKVNFKSDNAGLGKTEDWGSMWWDHAFNKACMSIKVEKDDSGKIKIEKQEESTEKQEFYNGFVKADVKRKDYSIRISDKELLAACEGRTARKGARIDQKAKIKRLKKTSAKGTS